jgi:hypothetical protein
MANGKTEKLTARIPYEFFDAVEAGDITGSMFLAYCILHRWADWRTGIAPKVSARGLETWSNKAYSEDTFQKSLRRLDQQGWTTRDMVLGSHKSYPVAISNYEAVWREPLVEDGHVVKEDGKVVFTTKTAIVNLKQIRIWREVQNGSSAEAPTEEPAETSDETPDEAPTETSDETSERTSIYKHGLATPSVSKHETTPRSNSSSAAAAALGGSPTTTVAEDWREEEPVEPEEESVDHPVGEPAQPVDGPPAQPEAPVTPTDSPPDSARPPKSHAEVSALFWNEMGIPEPRGSVEEFARLRSSLGDWEGKCKFGLCLGWLGHHAHEQRSKLRNAKHPLAYLRKAVEGEDAWLMDIVEGEISKAEYQRWQEEQERQQQKTHGEDNPEEGRPPMLEPLEEERAVGGTGYRKYRVSPRRHPERGQFCVWLREDGDGRPHEITPEEEQALGITHRLWEEHPGSVPLGQGEDDEEGFGLASVQPRAAEPPPPGSALPPVHPGERP